VIRPTQGALLGVLLCFARAIALALDADHVGVVDEAFDERSGAHGIGKDGGPVAEEQVRGHDGAFLLVTSADDLEQQVCVAVVEREKSDLVDHEQCDAGVVADAALEGASAFLLTQVEQEIGCGDEEGGVAGEHGMLHDVLGD